MPAEVEKIKETDNTPDDHITIVVLGASGDLAKKKTYPALFTNFKNGYFPKSWSIVGYARSELSPSDYEERITSKIKADTPEAKALIKKFVERCSYTSGQYNKPEGYKALAKQIQGLEKDSKVKGKFNRVFYMALPPGVFIDASQGLKENCYGTNGWNRLVVEKPFGKDLESSKVLANALSKSWKEDEIYRIDHYLGKEMVKNFLILRFANVFMGAIWNRHYIDNVQITFKEDFGTEGRGGYFDEYGMIRDVMQNHMLQLLCVATMEKPVTLSAEDIRNEKVKVLRAIPPLQLNDVLLGQYVGTKDGSKKGYKDDETVPKDSVTETFAAAVLRINNERWQGVPFIMKCGKALNEIKTEVRIQFKDVAGQIFPQPLARNELVIRVQPEEAVYMKMMNKVPGLNLEPHISELNLTYSSRYKEVRIPDAYESLVLDILKGDQSNFVRADELDAAWKIFTPLLHKIEGDKIKPDEYTYGDRGPGRLNDWIKQCGFVLSTMKYEWKDPQSPMDDGKKNKL